ncbi:carbon-nitrogen hydrolase family protein [Chachezhania antarctica]|uniref:carbon-nitrogen hydrolase family protein n=1 Tax=Chachezhania antarctica TaxID=2340860 RepID=UPI000EB08889|nr:carbon-nitrogen hydrolase family protein [Chachezhania antarctica]|tara:strand:- start:7739 stop:8500 length:762 start_codon:yes stop_codon:yes gene_type:complete
MQLALCQTTPLHGDIETGFTRLDTMTRAAAQAGAGMIVFPELYLPGYNQPGLHDTLSQPLGGEWFTRVAGIARDAGCGITLGWAERDGDTVYNAATAFAADGTMLGHYRKIQLFGPMENASFAPGDAFCTFDLNGMRTALMICYDVEFAPHVRALAEDGVKLILVPTANPVDFPHVSGALVPARAAEMDLTIAYTNYCGPEGDVIFGGRSVIVGPDAIPLASAGPGPALLIADLDRPVPDAIRSTQLADFKKV